MSLFQKIRSVFGLKTEIEDSPLEHFDKVISERKSIEDKISKAQESYSETDDEFNSLIQKASSEADSKAFLNKLEHVTNSYLEVVSKLAIELKEKKEEEQNLEADLLAKAIQITAVMSEEEQKEVNTLLKVWEMTGTINEEQYDSKIIAISKAIESVCADSAPIKSISTKKESKKYEGHYSNVIVKNEEGKILFLKRANDKVIAPGKYCLPGGHIDEGETIEEAGLRELKEEAGLDAEYGYVAGKAKCQDGKWAFYMYAHPEDYAVKLLDGESAGMAWMDEEEWLEADLLFDLKDHMTALECRDEIDIKYIPEIKKAEDIFFEEESDMLIKGKAASVGEKRKWNGIEYVKTDSGKWVKTKSDKDREKKDKDKSFKHTTEQIVSHAENTSSDQLKKIISDESKPHHVRDAAKRELERREDGNKEKEKLNKLKDQVAKKEQKEQQQKEKEKAKAKKEKEAQKEEEKKPKKIKPDETFSGTLTLLKNTEKAPNMGSRFGQDVEPAGFYATQKESEHLDDHPNYKTFTVDIKKPLVIDVTEDLIKWKRDLSDRYKAKGAKLSKMLMEEGYDSIITTDKHGFTGEIIVLNTEKLKESNLRKSDEENDILEKAGKHYEHVKVVRDGKVFYQYREVGSDKIEDEITIGDYLTSDLDLKISKYSDKAFLITGDTYKNLELLRKLKADVGIGSWNKTLGGWIFPSNAKHTILTSLFSKMPEGTFEETKAKEEVTQMKNAVDPGTTITVDGGKKVEVQSVDLIDGNIGYNIKGKDKVLENEVGIVPVSKPEDVINDTNEENRFKSGKELFGKEEGEAPVSDTISKDGGVQVDIPIKEFITRSGDKVDAIDYTGIKQMDIQIVDQDGILERSRPNWCADINLEIFAGRRNDNFLFDYVKLNDDSFLLATNGYEKSIYGKNISDHKIVNDQLREDLLNNKYSYIQLNKPSNEWGNSTDGYSFQIGDTKYQYSPDQKDAWQADRMALNNNHVSNYAVVSLDQIVAMQDYYQKKAKAVIAEKKKIETERVLDKVKEWSEDKIKHYYPFDYDKRLSEKQKNKYTKEEWEALPKDAKIAEIPFMKSPAIQLPTGSRISQTDDKSMWNSNFEMYKKFVDHSYKTPKDRGKNTYTLDSCVTEYNEVRDQLQWRKHDLAAQREENDSSYDKAFQTSYGDIALKDDLVGSHGVKIKLQNGKEIKANHIEQIKESLSHVYGSFGDRSNIAREHGLKISHSGEKLMFARKALGLYVPSLKAIGVSDNKTHNKFGFTLAHEFAHFIDNYVGNKNGRHYASDNLNSTAGKIANTFRSNMNTASDSPYINRTCENFARALEQYHAMRVSGEDAIKSEVDKVPYHLRDEHVSKEKFNKEIKPLIEQFFKEHEDLLKAAIDDVNIIEIE